MHPPGAPSHSSALRTLLTADAVTGTRRRVTNTEKRNHSSVREPPALKCKDPCQSLQLTLPDGLLFNCLYRVLLSCVPSRPSSHTSPSSPTLRTLQWLPSAKRPGVVLRPTLPHTPRDYSLAPHGRRTEPQDPCSCSLTPPANSRRSPRPFTHPPTRPSEVPLTHPSRMLRVTTQPPRTTRL